MTEISGLRDTIQALVGESAPGRKVELLAAEALSDGERAALPEWWLRVDAAQGAAAVSLAVEEWQKVLPDRLPRWLALMSKYGRDIFISRITEGDRSRLVLLYVFGEEPWSEYQIRFGFLPRVEKEILERLGIAMLSDGLAPELWPLLPEDVRRFYVELHDGFLDRHGAGVGIEPIERLCTPGDFDDPEEYEIMTGRSEEPLYLEPEEWPDISKLVRVSSAGYVGVCANVSGQYAPAWEWNSDGMIEPLPKGLWEEVDSRLADHFLPHGISSENSD